MEKMHNHKESVNACDDQIGVTRRKFFGKLGGAAIGAAAIAAARPALDESAALRAQSDINPLYLRRATANRQYRIDSAEAHFNELTTRFRRIDNGDELRYPSKIGNYSKGLPHQPNGEVVTSAYQSLVDAIDSANPVMFEQIPLGGARKLTNPQAGFAFDMEGYDAFSMIQVPPPRFASREIGAEIAENYWMALLRDVPFTEYSTNPIAAAAAQDLNAFGTDFKGPKNTAGSVTPNLLFRGLTPGDKAGPLMSQFWYHPCNFGANTIDQRIRTAVPNLDYMTDFNSWLAIQNGANPGTSDVFDPTLRYMRNGRDLGQWVHIDVLFQGYFQAFLVMLGLGVPFDTGNPYNNSLTQNGFATFGGPHVATLLCEVATRALKAVWNQKWIMHRRLRPEVFAARVHRTAYNGANYPIDTEILNSINTSSRLGGFLPAGNALLPMAFPEGSPTHPAYGAGHATVAGACTTVLKAWFDESFVIPNPVVPNAAGTALVAYAGDTLTVGGELNKIASNVANGRNIAGVHWRSDATESLKLGESIAIGILKDQKLSYNEQFSGFSLTKFDGTTVVV